MTAQWTVAVLTAGAAACLAAGCGPVAPTRSAPLIGLTSSWISGGISIKEEYAQAIRDAGGVPVILPVVEDASLVARYVQMLDGLVLSGGDDVPPEAYGQKPHPKTQCNSPRRHAFEDALLKAWLKTGKPLLAICRGAQQLNVSLGGTLIQDIPDQVGQTVIHRDPNDPNAPHEVTLEAGSRLRKLFGVDRIVVNSNHHQAPLDVAPGLKVVARSADGVIEAMEFTDGRFALIVQWHPERIADEAHKKILFGAFMDSCRKGK